LEPLVETADDGADLRLRIEAGAHFVRLLRSQELLQYRDAIVTACGFARPQELSADPLLAAVATGVPDGNSLAKELDALVEGRASRFRVDDEHKVAVTEVAKQWLVWFDRERGGSMSAGGDAWDPHRFEHRLRLASSAAGGVVLSAGDYAGETLGWSEFDVDPAGRLPSFQLPPPVPVDLSATPTPVRFGGMPSPRYWEFEDARFDFGNVDAAGHDLGRLLLVQFAALFGNDWFLVPVPLEVGSLTELDHVIVTDVFGRHFAMTRAGDARWDLFSHHPAATHVHGGNGSPPRHPAGAALLLPPTLGGTVDSDALELVHLLRDEMANLAWGIERYRESPLGGRVDRHAAWLADRTAPRADPNSSDTPRYLVATEVPDYWIPLVPRQLADRRSIQLVVTPLAVPSGEAFRAAEPEGRLLRSHDGEPLWVYEEEVPRAGVTVDRIWKYGRWHDGRSFLWKARRKRTGRGEGSSGLRFDTILPK
jgi:hypothetical protein